MEDRKCVYIYIQGERESKPQCKMLATEESTGSIDGSLLSCWCKFSSDSKVFKLKSWKLGKFLKKHPLSAFKSSVFSI